MKKILSLLILPILLLTGCHIEEPSYQEPYYEEVKDLHINWIDLFNVELDTYYVYIYSVTCIQCSALRDDLVNYARKENSHLYFVYPSEDITFTNDEELALSSLNKSNLEDIYIYTTPTLMEINKKIVSLYNKDYYEIRNILGMNN